MVTIIRNPLIIDGEDQINHTSSGSPLAPGDSNSEIENNRGLVDNFIQIGEQGGACVEPSGATVSMFTVSYVHVRVTVGTGANAQTFVDEGALQWLENHILTETNRYHGLTVTDLEHYLNIIIGWVQRSILSGERAWHFIRELSVELQNRVPPDRWLQLDQIPS